MSVSIAIPLVIGTVPNTLRGRICGHTFYADGIAAGPAVYPAAISGSVCSKFSFHFLSLSRDKLNTY